MPGMADYLNRDTTAESGDLGPLCVQAAQLHHRIASIADARRRAAEMAQMTETDSAKINALEQTIQKCGAVSRDNADACTKMRKHGIGTAVKLEAIESTLREVYADCIIKPAPV